MRKPRVEKEKDTHIIGLHGAGGSTCDSQPDPGNSHASSGESLPEPLVSPIARVLIFRFARSAPWRCNMRARARLRAHHCRQTHCTPTQRWRCPGLILGHRMRLMVRCNPAQESAESQLAEADSGRRALVQPCSLFTGHFAPESRGPPPVPPSCGGSGLHCFYSFI